MKMLNIQNILLIFVTLLIIGCIPDPKPQPARIITIDPGEKGNRRTSDLFRNTAITPATDLLELRLRGQDVFATPFNVYDGLGDGPSNPANRKEPGGRLTLPAYPSFDNTQGAGNQFFLRVNGLDSQTCLECHSIVDNSKVPAVFGVGGVGGTSANAFPMATILETTNPNPANSDAANFDGRIINPPFVFGSGGIDLLAKEMTASLQAQLAAAPMTSNEPIYLETHTVKFGSVSWMPIDGGMKEPELDATKSNCDLLKETPNTAEEKPGLKKLKRKLGKLAKLSRFIAITKAPHIYSDGKRFGTHDEMKGMQPTLVLDTSKLEGIDGDLVVKPFGRKGNNTSTRDFDCGALRFHMGMEPVEVVGKDNDHDGDGVVNEITVSELSALTIYNTTTARPRQDSYSGNGDQIFKDIGCASCHKPVMRTNTHILPYQHPELHKTPFAEQNRYYQVNLKTIKTGFETDPNNSDSLLIKLFSDLKRHDMGPRLKESLAGADDKGNRSFITARLWGVADTAPYLHDGRATTISEAIKWHGGEAEDEKVAFNKLDPSKKIALLEFLKTLHAPLPEDLVIE